MQIYIFFRTICSLPRNQEPSTSEVSGNASNEFLEESFDNEQSERVADSGESRPDMRNSHRAPSPPAKRHSMLIINNLQYYRRILRISFYLHLTFVPLYRDR